MKMDFFRRKRFGKHHYVSFPKLLFHQHDALTSFDWENKAIAFLPNSSRSFEYVHNLSFRPLAAYTTFHSPHPKPTQSFIRLIRNQRIILHPSHPKPTYHFLFAPSEYIHNLSFASSETNTIFSTCPIRSQRISLFPTPYFHHHPYRYQFQNELPSTSIRKTSGSLSPNFFVYTHSNINTIFFF